MARTSTGRPNGVKLKKRNPSRSCRASSAFTTRLGAVATSVSMPLTNAATLSGIISRLGGVPVLPQIRRTTGMKIATTAVELMRAPSPPTATISNTRRRVSLVPADAFNQSPSRLATPVRTKPSPITKSAAIRTILESLNPANASLMLMMPVNGIATIMIIATTSMRGRSAMNIAIAAARSRRTIARSVVKMASPSVAACVHAMCAATLMDSVSHHRTSRPKSTIGQKIAEPNRARNLVEACVYVIRSLSNTWFGAW